MNMNSFRDGMKKSGYRLAAALLLLVVLVSIALLYRANSPGEAKLQPWREVFSLTVHAADGSPETVPTESTAAFGGYRVTDSKAPGYALVIDAAGADEIRLKASAGSMIRWDAPDYKVNNVGTQLTVTPGETAYWTPFVEEMPETITESELILSAYKDRVLISEARFLIQSDQEGVYSGRWTEEE